MRKDRVRVCDVLDPKARSVTFTGTLYAQFRPYFDYLLNTSVVPERGTVYESMYVPNKPLENKLLAIADGPMNQSIAFTGNMGSGKSTTIRYLFGDNRNPSIKDDSQIVIPFFIDGIRTEVADIEETIVSQILVASDIVIEEHGVQIDDASFLKFIKENKRSLLRGRGAPRNGSASEMVSYLEEKKPYAFAAERLKYACEYSSKIDRVLLVVDDIESAPYEKQLGIVKSILSFKNCLTNTRNEERTFKSAYIFSCRPATYELLKRERQVNGFPRRKPVFLEVPATIDEMLRRRFQFAITALGEGKIGSIDPTLRNAKDMAKWRAAFEAFGGVMNDITGQFGHLILQLSNNDIRQTMAEIQNLLEHSSWFEKDTHQAGAFDVRDNDYRTTHVGIFRAMILQNAPCFSYQSDSVLVNPFYNFEHPDSDLLGCHIFKYFFQQAKGRKIVLIDERELQDKLEICYREQTVADYFSSVMDYFENEEAIRYEVQNGSRKVVPQNKLFSLYKSLSQTGVFLEFFRDATYQKRSSVGRFSSNFHSGTSRIATDNQFLALFDFVEQIIEAERDIFDRVRRRGLVEAYDKNFGPQLISKQVLTGITKNAHLYYKTDRRVSKLPGKISKRLAHLNTYLQASRLIR